MKKNGTCCFTGHRDFEWTATEREIRVFNSLLNNIIGYGYTVFKAGGALGFDTFAAEAVLRHRDAGAPIRLELVIPCADQAARWSYQDRMRYESILRRADAVECLHPHYIRGCMHERNRRMVDLSDTCLAYCKRPSGGTYYTFDYARKKGLTLFNVCSLSMNIVEPIVPGES